MGKTSTDSCMENLEDDLIPEKNTDHNEMIFVRFRNESDLVIPNSRHDSLCILTELSGVETHITKSRSRCQAVSRQLTKDIR